MVSEAFNLTTMASCTVPHWWNAQWFETDSSVQMNVTCGIWLCHHRWMCTITYFEGFVWNPPVFHLNSLTCFSLWARHGGQSSSFFIKLLFVTFWLAETALVISNLEPSMLSITRICNVSCNTTLTVTRICNVFLKHNVGRNQHLQRLSDTVIGWFGLSGMTTNCEA